MMRDFSKLCTPAQLYFAIAVIATVIALFSGASVMMAFWKILFALVWTFILNWLCKKGFKTLSWFLVLLPYIIIALAMFNIYRVTSEQRQMMRSVGLQGAYGKEMFSLKPGLGGTRKAEVRGVAGGLLGALTAPLNRRRI